MVVSKLAPGEPLDVRLVLKYQDWDLRGYWSVTALRGLEGVSYTALGSTPGAALDKALCGLKLMDYPECRPSDTSGGQNNV